MPSDCNCKMEPKIEAMEKAIETLEKSNNSHSDSHKEFYRRLRDLEKWQGVSDERYKNIDEKLDGLKDMVGEIAAKPGKRWEGIVDKAIWAVCAAVIAFLLAKVSL